VYKNEPKLLLRGCDFSSHGELGIEEVEGYERLIGEVGFGRSMLLQSKVPESGELGGLNIDDFEGKLKDVDVE